MILRMPEQGRFHGPGTLVDFSLAWVADGQSSRARDRGRHYHDEINSTRQ
jgi:hypothetical protein